MEKQFTKEVLKFIISEIKKENETGYQQMQFDNTDSRLLSIFEKTSEKFDIGEIINSQDEIIFIFGENGFSAIKKAESGIYQY